MPLIRTDLPRRSFLTAAGSLLAAPAFAQQAPLGPPPGAPAAGGAQPMIEVEGARTDPIPIAITGFGGRPGISISAGW